MYSSRKFKFHNLCVFQTCVLKLCVLALLLQNYDTGMITLSLSGWRRENAIESFLLRFHVKVRKFSSIFYRSVDFQYQKRANAKRSSFERYLSLFPFGKLSMLCVWSQLLGRYHGIFTLESFLSNWKSFSFSGRECFLQFSHPLLFDYWRIVCEQAIYRGLWDPWGSEGREREKPLLSSPSPGSPRELLRNGMGHYQCLHLTTTIIIYFFIK